MLQAAERRARDAKTCAQSSDIAAIVRATDLNSTVIDLTGDASDHDENRQPEAGPSGTRQSPIDLDSSSPSSSSSEDRRPSDRSRRRPHDRPATPSQVPLKKAKTAVADASETWTCPRCTLVNANNVDACEACLARGPGPRTAEGWTCHQVSFSACVAVFCPALTLSLAVRACWEPSCALVVLALLRDQAVILVAGTMQSHIFGFRLFGLYKIAVTPSFRRRISAD